uniref:Uncharacterized protein n=1 Tax=Hyaloperonospora arabidopsidis (strain Emoy2) TaxID=559515 RepID=M4BK98_HYAAE
MASPRHQRSLSSPLEGIDHTFKSAETIDSKKIVAVVPSRPRSSTFGWNMNLKVSTVNKLHCDCHARSELRFTSRRKIGLK